MSVVTVTDARPLVKVVNPPPRVSVTASGRQGPAGPSNLIVADTDPGLTVPGLWVQTFPDGDVTFWIEDGS